MNKENDPVTQKLIKNHVLLNANPNRHKTTAIKNKHTTSHAHTTHTTHTTKHSTYDRNRERQNSKKLNTVVVVIVILILLAAAFNSIKEDIGYVFSSNDFVLLSNPDNIEFERQLIKYAEKENIDLRITYMDDLEAIDELESNQEMYDAIWLSNSTWTYMINDVSVTNSKSININPVVFGIKKSKAEQLGLTKENVKNKDIIEAIKTGQLNYVMPSVTKTNTGLTAYLGFLNALSGSPEILTSEHIKNPVLAENLKTLFSGVQRVSGSVTFLEDMFLNNSEYEAVIATESSLIKINKELESQGKETLYLIYPSDGVAINDSPFAYIDNDSEKKLEQFQKLQSFLLSNETQLELEKIGKRTWYGGVKTNADSSSFKKEWGINTEEYLMPLKYPSKSVISDALVLYIDAFRKPASVAFCLDYSGSMYGDGEEQLKEAMSFILDLEQAKEENLQFSEKDKIYVIPFESKNITTWTSTGRDTESLIMSIDRLEPSGGTNFYDCAIEALNLVSKDTDEYTKSVIVMSDGMSNAGYYSSVVHAYDRINQDIPIYSILFGSAEERELEELADLTNAKVFDGRKDLIKAFKEVRSYN